ncbi:MAG: hypothetical protein SF002_13490, partial [Alphaproteobacteria bacterium]|nr:hypothetical protein [Alphaproteobacteria bacterium]
MHWYDTLCAEVAEHTGQAQVRLLRAILLGMSPPYPGRASVSVKQAEVLERLGEALADATLRQRVKAINDAAEVITRWGADRPFVLHSKKPEFVVEFSAGYLASTTLGPVERSTDEDTKAATVGAQKPRAQKPMQVFVSHAWENISVEDILNDFIADLKRTLARPPRTWAERFPKVEVFFDRASMTGTDSYTAQAMAACEQSRLAIFMLSNGWYHSAPCQAEARHFIDADGKPYRNRVIAVQLIHDVEDRPESFKDWPIHPRHGGHKHDTLVALWERGDITDKEKLVRAIAEDVWLCLSQAVDDDLPLPI